MATRNALFTYKELKALGPRRRKEMKKKAINEIKKIADNFRIIIVEKKRPPAPKQASQARRKYSPTG